jgi:hypothetical protein
MKDDKNQFGEPVHSYSRAQALEEGTLVDVTEVAREAGFSVPVAMTYAAYTQFVEWAPEDTARQVYQDESGRLWDVLYMARAASRTEAHTVIYKFLSVARGGRAKKTQIAELKMVSGPGDTPEPVITIMLPSED